MKEWQIKGEQQLHDVVDKVKLNFKWHCFNQNVNHVFKISILAGFEVNILNLQPPDSHIVFYPVDTI